MPYSQNLLDMSDNSQTQMTGNLSQPLRPLSQQPSLNHQLSLNNSARGSFVQNRVPASRLNLTPESINVNVAKALKQVHSRLEDFPVIVSRMLEEGVDYVEKDFKATKDMNEDELKELTSKLESVMRKVQDKDDHVDNVIGEVRSMSETLETLKKDKAKYLDLIDKLQMIIDKQKKIIEQLKEENSSMKTKTIRVKIMEKLLTPIRSSPRPVLWNVWNMVPEEDHCRYTPRPILMKPILTPSSS